MADTSPSSPRERDSSPPNPIGSLVKEVLRDLALQEDDLLVDLSCGEGRFADAILEQVNLHWQIIGVEASRELLFADTCPVGIRPVAMDLEGFARFPVRYHKALLHPRPSVSDLPQEIIARLHHQLIPGGRLVVVGSTPGDDVPLPTTALRHWAQSALPPEAVATALEEVGFSTRVRQVSITCHTPAAECLDWVARRAWPVLADSPDEEIEGGLEELCQRLGPYPAVTWTARFDLVTGVKTVGPESRAGEPDGHGDPRSGRSVAG